MARRFAQHILELTVFVCGAAVMVYEIIGSRILSPFIGASTYIWTSLIGVILAALSVGYWYGGRLADRTASLRTLAGVVFLAGVLVSVTVLVKEVFLSWISAVPTILELKALIAALVLFAPASVCLGIVTPFAIRLQMTSVETTGRTVGRLYALSTIGSIVGTFTAGFFLIPFVGSVRTLYSIAALLVVLAVVIAPLTLSARNIAGFVLLALGIASTEVNIHILRTRGGVLDIDTEYSRAEVFTTTDPATGRPIRALAFDPYITQSAMFLDSDELVFDYTRYYHLVRHFKPDFRRVLMIGGAGYSFPKEFARVYPDRRIEVVEIDPRMTQLARREFRLRDSPALGIIHEDGRMFIDQAPAAAYDAVFMDVAGSLFTVPTHLTTLEAVRNVSRILTDDGIVVFNLGSAITGRGSLFLKAELATYAAVFPRVLLFKVKPERPDDALQNLVIIASKDPNVSLTDADPALNDLLSHLYDLSSTTTGHRPSADVLTDDLAPVEYYTSIAQDLYVRHR